MTIHLDGIGEDWVVTRRPGGKPELNSYSTLEELQRILQRALDKAKASGTAPKPAPAPVLAPTTPRNGTSAVKFEKAVPEPVFDCTTCGACCAAQTQGAKAHVLLGRGERNLVGRTLPIVRRAGGEYLRTKKNSDGDTVCVALEGSVGEKCECSVYETRPMVCQTYEVGGAECLAARASLKIKA